jgi:hypothetical protein
MNPNNPNEAPPHGERRLPSLLHGLQRSGCGWKEASHG